MLPTLLYSPPVRDGSHKDAIPLADCLPVLESLVKEDKSMSLDSIVVKLVDQELSDN